MLLAHRGLEVGEPELLRQTSLDDGGLNPEELARLAQAHGLPARERMIDDDELVRLVRQGCYPIVMLYRKFVDGSDNVHAVIPIELR